MKLTEVINNFCFRLYNIILNSPLLLLRARPYTQHDVQHVYDALLSEKIHEARKCPFLDTFTQTYDLVHSITSRFRSKPALWYRGAILSLLLRSILFISSNLFLATSQPERNYPKVTKNHIIKSAIQIFTLTVFFLLSIFFLLFLQSKARRPN